MEKLVSSSSGNDNTQKLKDIECNGRVSDDADQKLLSTWPPRHYTCNFCKRRFKSAQALGGHMNVHRRARALLRSQSISSISSPSSSTSPWHSTNITTTTSHYHPLQNDHFILTNPNLNYWPLQNNHHHTRNPSYPYLLSHLPMMSITSPSTLMHVSPHSAVVSAYSQAPGYDQYLYPDQPFNGLIKARKNNCIRTDQDKLNGLLNSKNTHEDDPLVRLSLGNGLIISNSTDQQDIDLELHL